MHENKQQLLFDPRPAPWQLDDVRERWVASVVVPTGPPGELDYVVADELRPALEPGRRVRVPLGTHDRPVIGYCVRLEHREVGQRPLKSVVAAVDEPALVTPAMLRLTQWIADYYLCPLAQVLEAVVPSGVRQRSGTREVTLLAPASDVAGRLDELSLPEKQLHVLRKLLEAGRSLTSAQLMRAAGCTAAPITALRRKRLITAEVKRLRTSEPTSGTTPREPNLELNADQTQALSVIHQALAARQHQTILIRGVTGSGKTEVYIRAIQEVLSFGRQAIVLVPEISLTPQAQERFRARFGQVAVLHSHLSDSDRYWHWQRIARGEVSVVVGARSAVFAPTHQLGLIVLDEEHESTFKQDTVPRYHARDVALARARAEGVPLILGSATPSLESWHRACTGEFKLVEMPRRISDRPMPQVLTVDLRNETRGGGPGGAISRQLELAMREALSSGGQVILLLNRRGFSTHVQCPACGEVLKCPNCDVALTHHRQQQIALCHYCDYEIPAPRACPACSFAGIRYGGLGTQRLEAEVQSRFREYRCLRMDADSMRSPGSHERALAAFRSEEVHILLGTQMIAKGLDFPNVTLVGVINADIALHLPDFRAAERTFQLVVQVAGRTGRGPKGGRVLVQTFSPDHPAIRYAVHHDYPGFAALELPLRGQLSYPPLASMLRLVVRSSQEPAARETAARWVEQLQLALARHNAAARVLGPAPAPIGRLRGQYRYQVHVQSQHSDVMRKVVRAVAAELKPSGDVRWSVDVDPLDML